MTSHTTATILLPDETYLPPDLAARRQHIVEQLRQLPDEAFIRLQYLQPQVGCFNRCVFCSQHAGTEVWQFTRAGLRDLFAALRSVISERGYRLAASRIHKPGVLFPYLDNDVGSYPYLDEYVALVRDAVGCTVRITTVGFSGHNEDLVRMHQRIMAELEDGIAGLRLSVTPFTYGWARTAEGQGESSRAQFIADLATTLRTYRILLERRGLNRESFSAEIRFRPLVVRSTVEEAVIAERHVLRAGPHLLLSVGPYAELPLAQVTALSMNTPGRRDATTAPEPVFSHPGSPYLLVTSDRLAQVDTEQVVSLVDTDTIDVRPVQVWRLQNADGPYFAADPLFADDGSVRTLQIYPRTDRRESGYQDSTRYLLNAMLEHKKYLGLGRRDELLDATPRDIAAVLGKLRQQTRVLAAVDCEAAEHLRQQVLPLVADYARALLRAGLPAALFFSRQFTLDTGPAVNMGRARVLFKGITSTEDDPVSPWEARGKLISRAKGYVWRLAPIPSWQRTEQAPGPGRRGGRNGVSATSAAVFQEVDPQQNLVAVERDTGHPLREYHIDGIEVEHVRLPEARKQHLFPGLHQHADLTEGV